jgi:hypothetical protein
MQNAQMDAHTMLIANYTQLRSRVARGTLAAALSNVGVVIGRKLGPTGTLSNLTPITKQEVETLLTETMFKVVDGAFGKHDIGIIEPFGSARSQRFGQLWDEATAKEMLGLESAVRVVPLDSGGLHWFAPYSKIPVPGILNAGDGIKIAQRPTPDLIAAGAVKQWQAIATMSKPTGGALSNFGTGGDVSPPLQKMPLEDVGCQKIASQGSFISCSHLVFLPNCDHRTMIPYAWYAGIRNVPAFVIMAMTRQAANVNYLKAVGGALNVSLLINTDRSIPPMSPWALHAPVFDNSVEIMARLQKYSQYFTTARKADVL